MNIKEQNKKILILSFILLVIFFSISFLIAEIDKGNKNYKVITKEFNKELKLKENKAKDIINEVISKLKTEKPRTKSFFSNEYYQSLSDKEGISLLIYKKDSLVYWNDNAFEIPINTLKSIKEEKVLFLGNGWYDCLKEDYGQFSVLSLILLKHEYNYQNEFLNNDFLSDFRICPGIEISTEKGLYNIYSNKNHFLFSLVFDHDTELTGKQKNLINLFNIAGIIFLIIFLCLLIRTIFKNDRTFLIIISFVLIILRFISFHFRIPYSFYNSEIFSPLLYASSASLPSLGDLLLNSITILLILTLIFKTKANSPQSAVRSPQIIFYKLLVPSFWCFVMFAAFLGFIYIFRSLIFNSDIVFNFNNILNLTAYSFIGLAITSALIFTYYLLILIIVRKALIWLNNKEFILIILSNVLLFLIIYLIQRFSVLYLLVPLIIIITIWFLSKKTKRIFNLRITAIFILVFSVFITFLLNEYNEIKERNTRKLLALKLAEERDPTAEYLFGKIADKIKSDKVLKEYISRVSDNKVELQTKKYILNEYFKGYWKNYNIQITICECTDSLLIKPENANINCSVFFNNVINLTCKPTTTDNLYYRQNESSTNSYIAHLITENPQTTEIYIEIDSKFIPRDLGYPKLLIDRKLNITNDYSNYAYSKYKNGELIYQFGRYFYSSTLDSIKKTTKEFTFVNSRKYNHLVYNADKTSTYVISSEKETFLIKISPFSYLIIFFSAFFLILILIINYPLSINTKELSLQRRIQYSIILIVLLSFFFIGSVSVYYIDKSNKDRNSEVLREKTHSILVEIENKLPSYDLRLATSDHVMNEYISGVLMNLSNVFFTDINLYNQDGRLIATSRPKIFEEGLISKNMNGSAFNKMYFENKTMYMQKENIGKLEFYSSYMPVRNMHNKTIAYLNLPYFLRQSENKNEISTFLTTFINIYIILVALSVLIFLLISHYITSPLKQIQDKISRVKLGRINEKIEWHRNDELGKLVSEYNKMIDELGRSASLLAKSERESAWREMAKQVAHEIKNPLTPMKLNIQHLQKILQGTSVEHKEKIDRITNTLIEQIDILSGIASEFSDFAKLPHTNNEKVELSKVITNAVDLYKNTDNWEINFNAGNENYFVLADYKQLLRVFTNLITNSIQATEIKGKEKIDINVRPEGEDFLISITDKGKGISEQEKERIFSPNFTTKSGGTGLGLTMVKNIIESAGGKIWFESELNKGTVFYILLPTFKAL